MSTQSTWSDEVGKRAPNYLTFLRFLLVPVFVLLMVDPTPHTSLWATVLFIFAAFTDWLDGYLARVFQAESILGKVLDPLADKILVTAALVMLVQAPQHVPSWMVVVLLSREMVITGLRSLAALKGIVVPASELAKHKTAWTFIAIVALLIGEPYFFFGVLVDFYRSGLVFLWIAMILSVVSGAQYTVQLKSVFLSE